jgi:hypothetical protein
MQFTDVPMPPAVAVRPRDARGYPVLAITPWIDGVPDFGRTSTERVLVCAVERRCAICGTRLDPNEAWRVVAAEEAVAILSARERGMGYVNAAPTVEPPGHSDCMTYAAAVCPFLARPNARRGQTLAMPHFRAERGDRRGERDGVGGAVVGFRSYQHRLDEVVLFTFTDVFDCRPHRVGEDQAKALVSGPDRGPFPPWLGDDDLLAVERARRYV